MDMSVLRKVDTREFAKVLHGRSIVCTSCACGVAEAAKIDIATHDCNRSDPQLSAFSPRNALESALVIALLDLVCVVVGPRRGTKVATAVVERITVSMIDIFIGLQKRIVHQQDAVAVAAAGAIAIPFLDEDRTPIPLIQPLVIGSINNHILALSQGDQLDGLIGRLNNVVPRHTAFHSSNVTDYETNLWMRKSTQGAS